MTTERNTNAVLTMDELLVLASIEAARLDGMSLRKIAKFYGSPIKHSDIQRILDGMFPAGIKKRLALGLPAQALADVCTSCGEVHAIDRACEMVVTVKAKREKKPHPKPFRDAPAWFVKWAFENRHETDWSIR